MRYEIPVKPATKPRKNAKRVRRATAPAPGPWLHEPFLERAADPSHQDAGQHALGAFLTLRLVDRFTPDAGDTPSQALEYQTRATRDYLLDLHAQTAEVGHLLEIVRLADAVRSGNNRRLLWSPVHAFAYWLEQELRLAEALDVVDTALRLNDGNALNEEIAANLQRGRILRLLGRFDEAREAYESARAKAMSIGDMHSALLGRIGDAIVMRQVGNLPASEKALREILKDAEEVNDGDAQARAHHDLGLVIAYQERAAEAIPHLFQAFELFEQQPYKLRALSDVGESLKRLGHYQAAEDAFTVVLRGATAQMRVYTLVELLELAALTGNRFGVDRWKKEIETVGDELPAEVAVDFDLQLGLAHGRFGNRRKAEEHLRSATQKAERFRLNEYLFRAESALRSLLENNELVSDSTPVTSVKPNEEVLEIADKLCNLRAAS